MYVYVYKIQKTLAMTLLDALDYVSHSRKFGEVLLDRPRLITISPALPGWTSLLYMY